MLLIYIFITGKTNNLLFVAKHLYVQLFFKKCVGMEILDIK